MTNNDKQLTIMSEKGEIKLPCMDVKIVSVDKVVSNDYNPNHVAEPEMNLLTESILDNGFCFAIVTVYDKENDVYIVVDGFHRYLQFKDILKAKEVPIIVLEHDISKRMAATVQFNRARGKHSTELMADLVAQLSLMEHSDEEIAKKLGMSMEEAMRLKKLTNVAELFKGKAYSPAWEIKDDDEVKTQE